jgi:MoaA/NifB/PqqE/SkfB family radical SAM enzyme
VRWSEQVAVGYAFGTSLLSYLVDGPPRPFSATFAVTNRCNLRCSYCNCPYIDPTDLPLATVETLIDRLHEMGIRRLGLAGGEPMLRKDLGDIIGLAKARGMVVTVNSNLTLYQRRPEALAEADVIYTSLDGDEEAHEAARGGEKSYAGVPEAIRDLIARGKELIAICVVTEHSFAQSEYLLAQAEEVGFRVHFQPQCVDTENTRGSVPESITNQQFRAFWRSLLDQKKRGRPIVSTTPYLEFLSKWSDFSISAFYDAAASCPAGRGYFYIDPQGNAYPCTWTKGKTPPVNLLREDWRTAWGRETPCTVCSVGPMLEFNLLFQRPLSAALEAARNYR